MAKNERGIAQLPKERRFTRRHLLLSGAVGGIAIYQAARHPDALRDIYNSANELFVPEAPGRIIAQEIERLGIQYSPSEEALWKGFELPKLGDEIETSEKLAIVGQRISEVQSRMAMSENPNLRYASSTMDEMIKSGLLEVTIDDDLSVKGRTPSMVTSMMLTPEGGHKWNIQVSAKDVLEVSDQVYTAVNFAHEERHVEEFARIPEYNDPSVPVEERIKIFDEQRQDDDFYLAKEAQAYAVSAQAFIYEKGLWYEKGKNSVMEQLAAKFITTGSNDEGKEWIAYLKDLLRVG